MRPELREILRCPETQSKLALADRSLIDSVNSAIHAGQLRNRVGRTVEEPLSDGLLREDGQLLFPIVDDIPVMLLDEAIPLQQLPHD